MSRLTPQEREQALDKVSRARADAEAAALCNALDYEHLRYQRDVAPRGALRFVAATEAPDRRRDGAVLDMYGADLRRFHRNPVVLLRHDRDTLPIGRARAFVDDGRLIADVTFDRRDPLARRVAGKYRRGFLHGLSVAYDVLAMAGSAQGTIHVLAWELTELSVVTIPADPGAVRAAPFHPRRLRRALEMLRL